MTLFYLVEPKPRLVVSRQGIALFEKFFEFQLDTESSSFVGRYDRMLLRNTDELALGLLHQAEGRFGQQQVIRLPADKQPAPNRNCHYQVTKSAGESGAGSGKLGPQRRCSVIG